MGHGCHRSWVVRGMAWQCAGGGRVAHAMVGLEYWKTIWYLSRAYLHPKYLRHAYTFTREYVLLNAFQPRRDLGTG